MGRSHVSRPTAAARGAQIAHIDPATGRLTQRPSSQVAAQTTLGGAPLNRSFEGLLEQVLPNGAIMVDLENRFQTALVATIRPEGGYELDCDDTPSPGGPGAGGDS